MSKRIIFILPLNELSGSCVSAVALANILIEQGYTVDFICPKGDFISPSCTIDVIGFNLIKCFRNFIKIRALVKKSDLTIFFTIRNTPLAMFFGRKAILYLHEIDVNPKALFVTVATFIKFFFKYRLVVNPAMESIYGPSHLLSNFKDFDQHLLVPDKFHDFIMVSNCTVKKGVLDYLELAKQLPEKSFVLLTLNTPSNSMVYNFILENAPPNLLVSTEQEHKLELISGAKFLLNLSHLNETFGLTLLEAVTLGTIPLSFENTGSEFFYKNNMYFIPRDNIAISIVEKINKLESVYFSNLHCLQIMAKHRFSSAVCVDAFISIFEKFSFNNKGE
ncbi:glycosyltransferase family 4 protein [Shewanella baltica]|uniref:glycosyltransferase n=1 Tax=Shewanella baltica TaxID=62322 RepID=UPI00217CCF67|nr:glycosyltransferase [Shewanella baltica]MCS6118739.1 glycosyltransferase family 4 protein [Shewanella baltica]